MKRQRFVLPCVLLAIALGLSSLPARAQGSEVQLLLNRNFGYSSGSEIQGQFTLAVVGPSDMVAVTYLIDEQEMATVTQPPFRFSFNTDTYTPGAHRFRATIRTAAGQTLNSTIKDVQIVTPAGTLQGTVRVAGPIVGIVLLVMLAAFAVQFLAIGGNRRYMPGERRNYGPSGGAICPKCHRPFALSFLSLHLLTHRLARCPYCGKWSLVSRANPEALLAAEQAEAQAAKPTVRELSPEELLRRQIEESRISK